MTRVDPRPETTPKPLPTPLAMSTSSMEPTPSPLPKRPSSPIPPSKAGDSAAQSPEDLEQIDLAVQSIREQIDQLESKSAGLEESRPPRRPNPTFPEPKLRLKVLDLNHAGTEVFFANSNPCTALSKAVETVLSTLYSPSKTNNHIPSTRSVTLILKSMDGVAYTTGSDSDDDDKKIYFSIDYILDVSKRLSQPGQSGAEIHGVLVHEMVHCWQWNGLGTAPGGLIEGMADFVRLKAGLSPSHWKRGGEKWDAGCMILFSLLVPHLITMFDRQDRIFFPFDLLQDFYVRIDASANFEVRKDQKTAYFLEWIEEQKGEGSVRKINQALQDEKYEEEDFWNKLFGMKVEELWDKYSKSLSLQDSEEST